MSDAVSGCFLQTPVPLGSSLCSQSCGILNQNPAQLTVEKTEEMENYLTNIDLLKKPEALHLAFSY